MFFHFVLFYAKTLARDMQNLHSSNNSIWKISEKECIFQNFNFFFMLAIFSKWIASSLCKSSTTYIDKLSMEQIRIRSLFFNWMTKRISAICYRLFPFCVKYSLLMQCRFNSILYVCVFFWNNVCLYISFLSRKSNAYVSTF